MVKYIFLGTLLPDLAIGSPPEIHFPELTILLEENLFRNDLAKTQVLRRYYDIKNMRAIVMGDEVEPYGNYDPEELREVVLTLQGLPKYMKEFIEKYQKEMVNHFDELFQLYFDNETKQASGMLKKILQMLRDMRLVIAAFRSKKLNRDLLRDFQFENSEDPLVAEIIAQKDAKQFEPPERYQGLKIMFDEYHDKPLELHQAYYKFFFDKMDEWLGIDAFSIDKILVYMMKLIMVEKWMTLDAKKGLQIIDKIVKDVV